MKCFFLEVKMANKNLSAAKAAKNDEFYTELSEIQAELKNYKDKFVGKVVFCNCDDPFESNFVKYFLINFNRLGLKELIATGYQASPIQGTEANIRQLPYAMRVTSTKEYLVGTQTDLDIKGAKFFLETEQDKITYLLYGNVARDEEGNIIQIYEKEEYQDEKTGKIRKRTIKKDLYYEAGDFRSDMSIELLQQADIVVTNPPFSLFREYVAQLMQYGKQFLIIGNINALTYKKIFPLIRDNKIWVGCQAFIGKRWYRLIGSKSNDIHAIFHNVKNEHGVWFVPRKTCWFTNIDHQKRHEPIRLNPDSLYKGHENEYPKYDGNETIHIFDINNMPCDYKDAMSMPIGFLEKYCPEQFIILNCTSKRIIVQYKAEYIDSYIKACQKKSLEVFTKRKLIHSEEIDDLGFECDGVSMEYEYECPCGKGKIVEEIDRTIGFRSHDVFIVCEKCAKEYDLDLSQGTGKWRLIKKKNIKTAQGDL